MKRLLIIIIITMSGTALSGQKHSSSTGNSTTQNPNSGYVNINEIQYGYGTGSNSTPYTHQFLGITTLHGYQLNIMGLHINRSLLLLGGTGVLFYGSDPLLPFYLDIRYIWNYRKISPFIFGDSGLLLNTREINHGTKIFIHPGAGIKIKILGPLAASIGAGLNIQMGPDVSRATFLNLSAGIVFKPE